MRRTLVQAGLVIGTLAAIVGMIHRVSRADGSVREDVVLDPRQAMITALGAGRPHASLGEEAETFDRLVGVWDAEFGFHLPDGTIRKSRGHLRFGWILDGRAIQDIWVSYPEAGGERRMGTTIRFFDPRSRLWQVVFVSPSYNAVFTVQGGLEDGRIVLRGSDPEGRPIRWSFNDLRHDSFVWRGETSHDGGKSWVLEEEHQMRRRM